MNAQSIARIIGRSVHTLAGIDGGRMGAIVGEHLGDTSEKGTGHPQTHVLIDGVEYAITVKRIG